MKRLLFLLFTVFVLGCEKDAIEVEGPIPFEFVEPTPEPDPIVKTADGWYEWFQTFYTSSNTTYDPPGTRYHFQVKDGELMQYFWEFEGTCIDASKMINYFDQRGDWTHNSIQKQYGLKETDSVIVVNSGETRRFRAKLVETPECFSFGNGHVIAFMQTLEGKRANESFSWDELLNSTFITTDVAVSLQTTRSYEYQVFSMNNEISIDDFQVSEGLYVEQEENPFEEPGWYAFRIRVNESVDGQRQQSFSFQNKEYAVSVNEDFYNPVVIPETPSIGEDYILLSNLNPNRSYDSNLFSVKFGGWYAKGAGGNPSTINSMWKIDRGFVAEYYESHGTGGTNCYEDLGFRYTKIVDEGPTHITVQNGPWRYKFYVSETGQQKVLYLATSKYRSTTDEFGNTSSSWSDFSGSTLNIGDRDRGNFIAQNVPFVICDNWDYGSKEGCSAIAGQTTYLDYRIYESDGSQWYQLSSLFQAKIELNGASVSGFKLQYRDVGKDVWEDVGYNKPRQFYSGRDIVYNSREEDGFFYLSADGGTQMHSDLFELDFTEKATFRFKVNTNCGVIYTYPIRMRMPW